MAILKEKNTGKQIFLRSLHTFGRNAAKSDHILENGDASQLHASIRWNGTGWELVDHSTNGTMLNGRRIEKNVKTNLSVGQSLQFAPGAKTIWEVVNLDPPCARLLAARRSCTDITLDNFNLLPNETEPLASVYLAGNGLWQYETEEGITVLHDGDIVQAGQDVWKFSCSREIEATADMHHLLQQNNAGEIELRFTASLNEEHVLLQIHHPAGKVDLGERAHHYSLLTLARRRVADAQRGLDISSQGWVDTEELARMLGLEESHLNMQIFRARNQLTKSLPLACMAHVIERRRRELRFGEFRLQIIRGRELEASFNPRQP